MLELQKHLQPDRKVEVMMEEMKDRDRVNPAYRPAQPGDRDPEECDLGIEYVDRFPETDEYFELFGTTGWNEEYRAERSELAGALRQSWYAVSAYDGGRLVGFGRLLSDGVLYAVIFDMIVAPAAQGSGIGAEILRRLLEQCRRAGIRDVLLFSARGTSGFYEKFGFRKRPGGAPGMIMRQSRRPDDQA